MDLKKIPIGFEDFKKFKKENLYFVDKTLLMKELLDTGAQTTLLTRPRRFGKTLNLSMLRRFFEDERTPKGEKIDNRYLFEGLAIMEAGEKYLAHMGQYPVIQLTLKSAKQSNYAMAHASLVDEIIKEFDRHSYVLSGEMVPRNREQFTAIWEGKADNIVYAKALGFLAECLYKYHGKEAIILIDEYDVPLEAAYFSGFYDEMIGFIRSLFESALKTNPYLKLAVVTGCLRISQKSSFSDLCNWEHCSVISCNYSDYFGFTVSEVKNLLNYYGFSNRFEMVKEWYGGFCFGNTEVFTPWSVLNYIERVLLGNEPMKEVYWIDAIDSSSVKTLVEEADDITRQELEILMDGGTIEKPVHEEITYRDIHSSRDNLWNFLFFTGYLKMKRQRIEGERLYLEMTIPNAEVKSIYRQSIAYWFDRRIEKIDRSPLIKALEEGDCEAAEGFISGQLMDTISYFDYAESYYHGFLTGLLKNNGRYVVLSNRESGNGRADIILKTQAIRKGHVIILELKAAKSVRALEEKCREGLEQIEEKKYAENFLNEGYPAVAKYAVAFYKKECMVKTSKL